MFIINTYIIHICKHMELILYEIYNSPPPSEIDNIGSINKCQFLSFKDVSTIH